jgi:hypothetical protein
MTLLELNKKIKLYKDELYSDINNYVKENAKFKVGDIVKSKLTSGDVYFVINHTLYQYDEIAYYGNKIVKNTGKVSFMCMDSNVGTAERNLKKVNLKINGIEISRIEKCNYFKYDIKITI